MNEILQKRIEEAAKRYSWSHDTIGVDKETFHTEASQNAPIPIHKEVRIPIYHEMEVAFKCAAHFILNNLWISVDEALPEKEGRYLCNYHCTMQNSDGECDCVDFGLFKDGKWYVANNEVTHWAEIPKFYK